MVMSVVMPKFLEKENKKYVIEKYLPNGQAYYVANDDAPEEIKKEVKEWNEMFERAKANHIQL